MAEIQKEPDKIKPELTKEQKELAALNKLIFRMHAEDVTTIPPGDMRNFASVQCKPRETYDRSKISAAIKEYQAVCDDLKEKFKKAGLDADPEKVKIEASVKQVSESLDALNSTLKNKYNDWMSNRRSMNKSTVWDPSFTNINAQLESLHKTIKTTVEAQTPPLSEGLTKFQAAAEGLSVDKLQNQTFNEEVSRLNQTLTQQNRTDFSALKANELGYGVGGNKKIWTKKHVSEAERIEALAEHMGLKQANAANVGAHPDDKTWQERLENKGGAGLYGRDGSPFYIKVDESGSITAIGSPDDASFLSRVGSSLATIALAPFASFLPDDFWQDRKDKFKNHWNLYPFARAIEEMMDFATIDPSGLQHSKSVVMGYDNCKGIGKYDIEDVMTALRTAERKGLGFDVTVELAGVLGGSQAGRDALAAIEAYRAKLQLAENNLIKAGMGEEAKQQSPAPSVPTTPALSEDAAKKVTDLIEKADGIKVQMDAIKPKEEKAKPEAEKISVEALHMKTDDLSKRLDDMGVVVASVLHAGTADDCAKLENAVHAIKAAADSLAKVANSDPIKNAIPISDEPEKKEAYESYQAVVEELMGKLVDMRKRCETSIKDQVSNRRDELGLQAELRGMEDELGLNPNKENQSLESAVDHAQQNLEHLSSDSGSEKRVANKNTIKKYADKTEEALGKLTENGKVDDVKAHKVKQSIDEAKKGVSPAPGHP